ncbi:hypothetical protein KSP40_PGU013607 [Platanthera guangdongensis]|uniref:Uncharacterized protein n=1 Tax=Platanthera guangdongensis TaxID=2320717 RepID=A0ABR2MK22_9ASPA
MIAAQPETNKLAAENVRNLLIVTAFSSQDRILCLFHLAQVNPHCQSINHSWLADVGLDCSKFHTTVSGCAAPFLIFPNSTLLLSI